MERPPQLGGTYFRRAAMFERAFVATRHRHAPLVIPRRRWRLFPLGPRKKWLPSPRPVTRSAGRVAIITTQWENHEWIERREIRHRRLPMLIFHLVFTIIAFHSQTKQGKAIEVRVSHFCEKFFRNCIILLPRVTLLSATKRSFDKAQSFQIRDNASNAGGKDLSGPPND